MAKGLSLLGQPAGQENAKGRKIALPALPYSPPGDAQVAPQRCPILRQTFQF